jgi:hypothetical protein
MNDPTPATPTPGQLAAERYAALVAIRDAFDALAKDEKAEALKHAAGLKSASWSTPYGAVNVTTTDPKIVLDEDAFLAMVQEHYPDDVVVTYSVSPALRAAFLSRLVEVSGQVVHRDAPRQPHGLLPVVVVAAGREGVRPHAPGGQGRHVRRRPA